MCSRGGRPLPSMGRGIGILSRPLGSRPSTTALRPSRAMLPAVVRAMEGVEDWMRVSFAPQAGLSPRSSNGIPATVSSVTLEEETSSNASPFVLVNRASSGTIPSNPSSQSGAPKVFGTAAEDDASPFAHGSTSSPRAGKDRSEELLGELTHNVAISAPCEDYYPVGSMELDAVLTKELVEGGLGAAGSQPAVAGEDKHIITSNATSAAGASNSDKSQAQTNPMVMSLRSFLNEEVPSFPFAPSSSCDDKATLLSA